MLRILCSISLVQDEILRLHIHILKVIVVCEREPQWSSEYGYVCTGWISKCIVKSLLIVHGCFSGIQNSGMAEQWLTIMTFPLKYRQTNPEYGMKELINKKICDDESFSLSVRICKLCLSHASGFLIMNRTFIESWLNTSPSFRQVTKFRYYITICGYFVSSR